MLAIDDFWDKEKLKKRTLELAEYSTTAGEMYTGQQHLKLMEGIRYLRSNFGDDSVSVKILSAGYGLLDESEQIVPYELTFNSMRASQIDNWANFLGVKHAVEEAIKGYKIVFFLLGNSYIRALKLPVEKSENQRLVFLAGPSSSNLIPPDEEDYLIVPVGQKDAKLYKFGLIGLKGYLFNLLCKELVEDHSLLKRICIDPMWLLYSLQKYRHDIKEKMNSLFGQLILPTYEQFAATQLDCSKPLKRMFIGFNVRSKDFAANYRAGKPIKYYIPEWDDRVDPAYDFILDTHNRKGSDPYQHDVYAHEIYGQPNYDGVLMSLALMFKNTKAEKIKEKNGAHNFIRLKNTYPMMADCGAFDYIKSDDPPFKTDEVLTYYEELGFDYGVSIDHLIIGPFLEDESIRRKRYLLTKKNAEEFMKKHNEGNYSFQPIGVAQGWDPKSYYESVQELVDLNYKYIALGSLIPKKTYEIYDILKVIAPIIPEYMDVHLFGIARTEGIKAFYQLGATSFDSASPLRRAWLGAGHNYFTMEKDPDSNPLTGNGYKKYTAIRIPYVNPRLLPYNLVNILKTLEMNALDSLRQYDKGIISCDQALQSIIKYETQSRQADIIRIKNKLAGNNENNEIEEQKLIKKMNEVPLMLERHKALYRQVLENRPWKNCDCRICKEIGVEVIIFRGNNRNRRRGFHNTYVFNKQFRLAVENKSYIVFGK